MPTAIGAYATLALVKARITQDSTFTAAQDAVLSSLCDQVNQYIETATGRVLAPVSSAVYTFDGTGRRYIHFPRGIRAVSLLEVAGISAGSYSTSPSTDYMLRPLAQDRTPGWPATQIQLSNVITGSFRTFPTGYGTVRVTMTTGWDAIPDDIIDVALTTVTRAWHARQSGQVDIIGNSDTGEPTVSRFVAPYHHRIIDSYRVIPVG